MGQKFLIAAYCCTWAIQLGYALWTILRWQRQKRRLKSGV